MFAPPYLKPLVADVFVPSGGEFARDILPNGECDFNRVVALLDGQASRLQAGEMPVTLRTVSLKSRLVKEVLILFAPPAVSVRRWRWDPKKFVVVEDLAISD